MKFKIFTLLCFALIVFSRFVEGQAASRNAALFAVECVAEDGVCERQNIVRFRFKNGELISKDIIFTSQTTDVRFDLGENFIYRNRYVISNWGDVVDTQTKSLLHDSKGDYVAAEGNQIIIKVDRDDVEGYFYFDLERKTYARLPMPGKWTLPGVLSPDQSKSVSGDDGKIRLHRLKRKEKTLSSGFIAQTDISSSEISSGPPLFWLDNERVLTQKSNGEIVVLYLDGTVKPVVKIPIEEPNYTKPFFFRNGLGQIIYGCGGKTFIVDVESKTYAPYKWLAFNSRFEAENGRDKSYGHIIRFQGREIGRLWGGVWSARTTGDYFAADYNEVGSNSSYSKGIKVWSGANGKWTTIELDWLDNIIGLIDE
jgi:hypothetical protein